MVSRRNPCATGTCSRVNLLRSACPCHRRPGRRRRRVTDGALALMLWSIGLILSNPPQTHARRGRACTVVTGCSDAGVAFIGRRLPSAAIFYSSQPEKESRAACGSSAPTLRDNISQGGVCGRVQNKGIIMRAGPFFDVVCGRLPRSKGLRLFMASLQSTQDTVTSINASSSPSTPLPSLPPPPRILPQPLKPSPSSDPVSAPPSEQRQQAVGAEPLENVSKPASDSSTNDSNTKDRVDALGIDKTATAEGEEVPVVVMPTTTTTATTTNKPKAGHLHTTESRRKISVANKGKTPWNKGGSHTEETRRKIAESSREAVRRRKRTLAAAMVSEGSTACATCSFYTDKWRLRCM